LGDHADGPVPDFMAVRVVHAFAELRRSMYAMTDPRCTVVRRARLSRPVRGSKSDSTRSG
jgi:hypothetical protein